MSLAKISESGPNSIASVIADDGFGRIGIALCEGKKKVHRWSERGDRNPGLGLDEVVWWGPPLSSSSSEMRKWTACRYVDCP